MRKRFALLTAAAMLAAHAMTPTAAFAQEGQIDVADTGDTAWVLVSSLLVLMMALPGLALFYGGLVRAKNVLSVFLQCGAIAAVAALLWIMVGYTLAFGDVHGGWLGTGNAWMLIDLGNVRAGLAVPESAFALFQMAIAAMTPVLMVGAWAERARFGWVIGFCALWGLVVHAPVAHWIWGGGWLSTAFGTLDFAGGLVIHTSAGVSALVAALLVGRRQGFPRSAMLPHNPSLAMAGAALLWIGWLGLNGGSAAAANDDAASAIINTLAAACAASLVWLLIEHFVLGKATGLGFSTGVVAGLVAVSPAAGFISPGAAVIFGASAACACYGAIQIVKRKLQIDDSLDVFAVHGIGGIIGAVLLAVFLAPELGGTGYAPGMAMGSQLVAQAAGIAAVALWSAVGSAILAVMVSIVLPMRVSEEIEREGLDTATRGQHTREMD